MGTYLIFSFLITFGAVRKGKITFCGPRENDVKIAFLGLRCVKSLMLWNGLKYRYCIIHIPWGITSLGVNLSDSNINTILFSFIFFLCS